MHRNIHVYIYEWMDCIPNINHNWYLSTAIFVYVCIYVFVCIYMYISGEVVATTDADESIIYAELQLDKIDEMRQGKWWHI